MSLQPHIRSVAEGGSLSPQEAEDAFSTIMRGEAKDTEMAGFLLGLRARGETPAEVAGGVRAMRRAMVRLPVDDPAVVDTCGTGGGALTTFNISTVAAIVAAAGGVTVAKHGNRSYSSRCGSADVLEAAGVEIELAPERLARVLERAGFAFMYAPAFHPAMRHVGAARSDLGVATIFNILGPLTNPASVRRQVVGVAEPALLELVAGALRELGHERAMVAHGDPGLDELSPVGRTRLIQVEGATLREREVSPADFGWSGLDPAGLAGGSPEENLARMEEVLQGRGNPAAAAAVALNAGAAFWAAGMVDELEAGVERAREVIGEGAGWETLREVRALTRAV